MIFQDLTPFQDPEAKFVHELEEFHKDASEGLQYFYAYLAIDTVLGDNKRALKVVNRTPVLFILN